jgi:excisionase family DNA binding protein
MDPLYTIEEVAERFGVTKITLVRFVRRHRIPLIEIKRGVCRITAAAVQQIEEAGQTHPATMSLRIESRPLPKLQVRSRTSAFESALALTTSILRAKKPPK